MASKAAATRGAAPSAPADAPPLCALVVLTPFHAGERTLAPLAVPPALLPVADRAAADYAIEWVLAGGADEVVVAWAGEPGGEVDAWFRSSPYASHPTPIRPLPLPTCASLGDLLREADRMELFRGPDVLLVRSAVCAPGLDPKALVARHRERKRNDPKVIMTSVWSPRSEGRQGKAVVVGEGGKLLHLGQPGEGVVKVPLETVEERGGTGEWEVSVGHEPAGVEVCEMNVLALFTENFDHGRLYAHLVPEVLDSEVLDHSFYVEFADFARGEYARRLVGTASWYQICTDVLARRTFPFVPDVPWHPDSAPCTFHPAVGTYIGDPPAGQPHWESRPNQTTSYVPYSPSGPPPQTTSLRSSLLHTPDVGPGTRISRSLVLPGASIGADCSLDLCVVGPGAAVADGTTVRGATLGAGSKVGPGTVGAGIVVSASQAEVLEDDEEEEGWEAYGLGYEHPGQEDGESDDDGGSDSDGGSVSGAMARLDLGKLVGRSAAPTAAQVRRAREELRSTVRRAIAEGHAAEDCFAELKTAKMAENVGWGEVRAAVCVEVAEAAVKEGGKKAGERWADLMGMVILERTKKEDGKEVVMLIADHIATHPNPAALSTKTLVPLLKALYDADAIEEDHVLGWWNASGARKRGAKDSHGAEVGEAHEKARAGVEPLVRWLMEAEEESEESDESG
ncbi:hypothetical protein DFJ74DRAFT_724775 [Hyaloraphidium curvatum]|nr:hypothetical protein DFJ74DRAFT_724775 [Hyaloraphidium curvatum]